MRPLFSPLVTRNSLVTTVFVMGAMRKASIDTVAPPIVRGPVEEELTAEQLLSPKTKPPGKGKSEVQP